MKNKIIIIVISLLIVTFLSFSFFSKKERCSHNQDTKTLNATIISKSNQKLTVQDSNNIIYTFSYDEDIPNTLGSNIAISYTGLLNTNTNIQEASILTIETVQPNSNQPPEEWQDNGLFKQYYPLAYNKLQTLSLDEKIGQLLLVRYSALALNDITKYNYSGFVFFKTDFQNKTKDQVIEMIENAQSKSKIPLLTAVDEEGGSVIRISDNPALSPEPFKSPSELYEEGGFNLIRNDTINKSKLLEKLGINLNLAPVVDVSTDPASYIYNRTLKEDIRTTSLYAKTVIEASKGTKVSYTLKHFPGYGNNVDTHQGTSTDSSTIEEITSNNLPPFASGINAGAEAVLVSHNIVSAIDSTNPASLSSTVHNLLRNDLNFTGVIITDDLSMNALDSIDKPSLLSLLSGNDLIITSDYETSFNEIKTAITNNEISEEQINKLSFRVLAWKYYKNIISDNEK